ncbi:LEM-3-like GIY-YIG domain-containing protein [Rhizobium rhizogenes]|uniref:LEM-3-like GIY-YIG domain-containing protein n=1 Tax=Rhizobium rhizogenes TaxID=359 RepID=UPI001572E89E|nr:hypothetical protein [Rhizobium rhizogenes]NTI75984.1 hypothetical protein [Rhizobium rhizogenes]
MKNNNFPSEVRERLGYYVYRLIDPRNGETFYIGKGKGSRVFHHAKANLSKKELGENDDDGSTAKIDRIKDIMLDGLEVIHVIQRHGMTEKEAFHVEGALIDAFPGLSNVQGGHGNGDFGAMHVDAIVKKYMAPRLICDRRIVFFTLRRESVGSLGHYEACRGIWRMKLARAKRAELAMPVVEGIVADVFVPQAWFEASVKQFPFHTRYDVEGRIGFTGRQADGVLREKYVGHRLPVDLEDTKTQNPVRYSYR